MSVPRTNVILLLLFGVTLPLSVVLSTNLARRSFERVKLRDQTINVKGYAERKIDSDVAKWGATISVRHAELAAGYAKLEADRVKTLAFLEKNGFGGDAVWLSQVNISTLYGRDKEGHTTNVIEGYVLSQSLAVTSSDAGVITRMARQSSGLIRDGIELTASPPTFLYTKMDAMKLQMLAEATTNARQCAEALVGNSHGRLGPLRGANQGVFQITPVYSTEVSGYGENDTTSIEKVIKAVVTVEYAIE